ncbi:unnamed protein product [Orchesella dallaii]|uniref:EB domain-containing protein n=1 Tax=Orchesella dallaii TaxID=48710 RepID=A0ABP1PJY8_9HEXA
MATLRNFRWGRRVRPWFEMVCLVMLVCFNYNYEPNGFSFRAKHGAYCDAGRNLPCGDQLQCIDGRCACKFPDDQIYQSRRPKGCYSLAGGPCTSILTEDDNDKISCGEGLECQIGSNGIGACACEHSFVETQERQCEPVLYFGQPCSGAGLKWCDKRQGLYCVNGTCTCKDKMKVYDVKSRSCVEKSSCQVSATSTIDFRNGSLKALHEAGFKRQFIPNEAMMNPEKLSFPDTVFNYVHPIVFFLHVKVRQSASARNTCCLDLKMRIAVSVPIPTVFCADGILECQICYMSKYNFEEVVSSPKVKEETLCA